MFDNVFNLAGQFSPQFGGRSGLGTIIRMFGVTKAGNSVCCHIHGFLPYFYVPAPQGFKAADCLAYQQALNHAVVADSRQYKDIRYVFFTGVLELLALLNTEFYLRDQVINVEVVNGQSLYGFHRDLNHTFLKITLSMPRMIASGK